MSFTISQPQANQTPDAVLGGGGVLGISNTGHGSTDTVAADGSSQTKSARWHTFQAAAGAKTAINLKVTHTSNGALSGVAGNTFRLQYTLNGGAAWITAVERLNFTTSQGPTTFSVALSAGQDISQVQVRVFYQATSGGAGDSASVSATISGIQLEVTTVDHPAGGMM